MTESALDFVQKDFTRVNKKYSVSEEDYCKWTNDFFKNYPKEGMIYETFKEYIIARDQSFKMATIDYQI